MKLSSLCGLLSAGAIAALPTAALGAPSDLMAAPPNSSIAIHRSDGTCPSEVDLWVQFRYYEGGGESSVLLDTAAIAGPAVFLEAKPDFVEFAAPLKSRYASCYGYVVSNDAPQYNVWFYKGYVYFRFDLQSLPGRPLSEILSQDIVEGRPFIRWAIAD